jgi:glucose-6-phosphate isomerase
MNSSARGLAHTPHTFFTVPAAGVTPAQGADCDRVLATLCADWQAGHVPPFFALLEDDRSVRESLEWAARIRSVAGRLIVFGIGGSSLGAEMLVHAMGGSGIPVLFYDNIDPETLASFAGMDWRRVFLLVVSKSGGTAETLSQFLTVLPSMERQLGARLPERVAVLTESPSNELGQIADALGLPQIRHPAVGGRFSVLSVVGLLPAAVAGVDVAGVYAGAMDMLARCRVPDSATNPAWQASVAQYTMVQQGRNLSVMMYYGDRFARLSAWFAQLWAESLGKHDQSGRHHGMTPVAARGVTDQHSQLQLYLDGPADKQFTLLYDPALISMGEVIDFRFAHLPSVAPLAGHRIGALFAAEFFGTRDALVAAGLPVREFSLSARDPAAFGALIALLQVETVMTAALCGINAFDQPAVEDGKRRARTYLQNMREEQLEQGRI